MYDRRVRAEPHRRRHTGTDVVAGNERNTGNEGGAYHISVPTAAVHGFVEHTVVGRKFGAVTKTFRRRLVIVVNGDDFGVAVPVEPAEQVEHYGLENFTRGHIFGYADKQGGQIETEQTENAVEVQSEDKILTEQIVQPGADAEPARIDGNDAALHQTVEQVAESVEYIGVELNVGRLGACGNDLHEQTEVDCLSAVLVAVGFGDVDDGDFAESRYIEAEAAAGNLRNGAEQRAYDCVVSDMTADGIKQLREFADGHRETFFGTARAAHLDIIVPDFVFLGARHAVIGLLQFKRFGVDFTVNVVASAEFGNLHLRIVVLTKNFERGVYSVDVTVGEQSVGVVTRHTVNALFILGVAGSLVPAENLVTRHLAALGRAGY